MRHDGFGKLIQIYADQSTNQPKQGYWPRGPLARRSWDGTALLERQWRQDRPTAAAAASAAAAAAAALAMVTVVVVPSLLEFAHRGGAVLKVL